jgi:hypothetical protein
VTPDIWLGWPPPSDGDPTEVDDVIGSLIELGIRSPTVAVSEMLGAAELLLTAKGAVGVSVAVLVIATDVPSPTAVLAEAVGGVLVVITVGPTARLLVLLLVLAMADAVARVSPSLTTIGIVDIALPLVSAVGSVLAVLVIGGVEELTTMPSGLMTGSTLLVGRGEVNSNIVLFMEEVTGKVSGMLIPLIAAMRAVVGIAPPKVTAMGALVIVTPPKIIVTDGQRLSVGIEPLALEKQYCSREDSLDVDTLSSLRLTSRLLLRSWMAFMVRETVRREQRT